MKRGRINARQLFWLAFVSMVATLVLTVPGELVRWAGRGAWWTPLAAATPMVPLAFLIGQAGGRQGDAVAMVRQRLGPVAGRGLLLAVWVALALDAAIVTREVAEGASNVFVHATVPVPLLVGIIVATGMWLAWLGPVVMGRVATAITLGFMISFAVGFVVATPVLHVLWARPLLPTDGRFLGTAPITLSWLWLIEPALFGALVMDEVLPSARASTGTLVALATAAGAVLLSTSTWLVIADFGPVRAAEFAEPLLHVMQELPYSVYLEHLDSFVVPVEILSALVKVGLFLWLWARVSYGLIDLPLAWLMPALALINGAASTVMFGNGLDLVRSTYGYALYILPALLVLFAAAYLPLGRRTAQSSRPA